MTLRSARAQSERVQKRFSSIAGEVKMDLTILTYVVYLVISIALTIWVAMTLSKAGRVFLTDVFHGDAKLAEAVNHLLVVGFYLVNLGFVALWLKSSTTVTDAQGVFTELSVKVGTVLL